MNTLSDLILALREGFGEGMKLPLGFWYSDSAVVETEKGGGCFFKVLDETRGGVPVSLCAENISCGGGRLYTGYGEMPERVPEFVSGKERYKQSPEMVIEYVKSLEIKQPKPRYLNFARIDTLENLGCGIDEIDGLFFYATPDVLCGLVAWANFDINDEDAVSAPFGSGCSATITMAVRENERNGHRCFISLFDPSVRPWVAENELGFVIPRCRLKTMMKTLRSSCLFGTHAWGKVRDRISRPR